MTITINLPPEEEARLQRRAARQGKDLNDFVRGVVQREAIQESYLEGPEQGQSLAEALEGLIGVLSSREKNDGQVSHVAENTGEEFTTMIVEKHKAGQM